MLDNTVGGLIVAGDDHLDCIVREAEEEEGSDKTVGETP